jgi:hypothetical protein
MDLPSLSLARARASHGMSLAGQNVSLVKPTNERSIGVRLAENRPVDDEEKHENTFPRMLCETITVFVSNPGESKMQKYRRVFISVIIIRRTTRRRYRRALHAHRYVTLLDRTRARHRAGRAGRFPGRAIVTAR